MLFETRSLPVLEEAVKHMALGFAELPDFEAEYDLDVLRAVMLELAEKMRDNYPYQHPLYVGQMLKPPHTVARLAYMLSLYVNPNNHALDGGRASSALEKEAVANIAAMFGFSSHLGHLTGGGTMANLEALWMAAQIHPGKTILASEQAHYTHSRISGVLGIPFEKVAVDCFARLDIVALEERLAGGDVGTVVVTAGTTSTGSVDSLEAVLALRSKYKFRIHVDAAYGGYFRLASNLDAAVARTYELIGKADSVVVDPHKHGYQPYGCGCVIFADPAVGALYKHDSPYTYFSSAELHLGEISLECSRPGAAAAALWATQQMFPLVADGDFAAGLEASRRAALSVHQALLESGDFILPLKPDLDILIYAPKIGNSAQAMKVSDISFASREMFKVAAGHNLHLALATLPASLLKRAMAEQLQPGDLVWDREELTVLRSCFLKPEHEAWAGTIVDLIKRCRLEVLAAQTR